MQDRLISLKVDAATRHDRGFLGINIQFLENGVIHIRTLGIIELVQKHTAEYLQQVIMKVLDVYGISVSNIYSFTSDNGANMVKLGRLLEDAQSSTAEESEAEDSTLSEEEEEEGNELNEAEMAEHQSSDEDTTHEALDESYSCELCDSTTLIANIRCAAHTLQLAVADALKTIQGTKKTIAKARRVVKELRKPTVRKMWLASNPTATKPKLDVATRWNSTADMLDSLVKLKDFCIEFSSINPHAKALHLSSEEWKFIEEYLQSLMPSKIATLRLQEEQLALGSFFGIWLQCKLCTAAIKTTLATELVKAMEAREGHLMQNDALLASVFLDPRYLSFLTVDQKSTAINTLEKLWEKLETLDANSVQCSSPTIRLDQPPARNGLLNEMDPTASFQKMCDRANATRVIKPHGTLNIRRLLEEYHDTAVLAISEDILRYWEVKKNSMPQLYRLAAIVLAAPATQVSVERLFSGLAYIFNSLRCNLTSHILDDIMVVRCNYHNTRRKLHPLKNGNTRHERRQSRDLSSPLTSSTPSTPSTLSSLGTPTDDTSYDRLIQTFANYQPSPQTVCTSHQIPYTQF